MSLLYYYLFDDDNYKRCCSILTLECYQMTEDDALFEYGSPVHSENVHTYFDGDFLHDFLMFYEQKRKRNENLDFVDMYQVFLGVFAMEHGVKVAQKDMEIMLTALVKANLTKNTKDFIREAFADYGRNGSLPRPEFEWVVSTED